MSDWNPSLYLHFAAERSRPAVELLARVPLENIEFLTLAESGNVVFTSRSNDREAIINCPQSFRAST